MSDTIDFAHYILSRIKEIGSTKIFGVPGDYFLEGLDYFEADPELTWVGSASELGAAYAADGYARVKAVPGVLLTTFGVGEFSALNGVAGAMAEKVPLLHIVGYPSRPLSTMFAAKHIYFHHTTEVDPRGSHASVHQPATCSQALLTAVAEEEWTEAFDNVLRDVLANCQPGYVQIPMDAWAVKVSKKGLDRKLKVLDAIVKRFEGAQDPVIIADRDVSRFGVTEHVTKLANTSGFKVVTTWAGDGCVDGSLPNHLGTWLGPRGSQEHVKTSVGGADLVLHLGQVKTDFNSAFGMALIDPSKTIEIYPFTTQIRDTTYPVGLRDLVPHLADALTRFKSEQTITRPTSTPYPGSDSSEINHVTLFPRDTGTQLFGFFEIRLPPSALFLGGYQWLSLGWGSGAVVGAALAASEITPARRTIILIGDGALQFCLTEIGTALKMGVCPYIFVLNNDGYDVERAQHGMTSKYNDIQGYDHQLILPMLAGRKCKTPHESIVVETTSELDKLLADPAFGKADKLRLIELRMPRNDVPPVMQRTLKGMAAAMKRD